MPHHNATHCPHCATLSLPCCGGVASSKQTGATIATTTITTFVIAVIKITIMVVVVTNISIIIVINKKVFSFEFNSKHNSELHSVHNVMKEKFEARSGTKLYALHA